MIYYNYLVLLEVAVDYYMFDKCNYKNFFCDYVKIELSFSNLFIIDVGIYC